MDRDRDMDMDMDMDTQQCTYEQQDQQQEHQPYGPDRTGRTYQTPEAYGYQQHQQHIPQQHIQEHLQQHLQQQHHHHEGAGGESQTTASSSNYQQKHQQSLLHYSQHHREAPSYHEPHLEEGAGQHPPLLEIPEEIYTVRKAALQVLKPLTSSWLMVSVGFAISTLLGMARWTRLLPHLPYWFVLLPSWFTHVGLLWCHVRSARALSRFIQQANENRQRPNSTDHYDRTEYLPLLQRSLKFGLKTGLLSFCTFLFEVLGYLRIAKGEMPLSICFIPFWMIVVAGVLDGLICKTQSFIRLLSWMLVLMSMIMATMRIDYGLVELEYQLIVAPIIAVLTFASLALLYIVYGHQVGYYRLTESQLTAGILYSMSAVTAIVLVVVVAQVMPLSRPVELETRFLVVIMAPLVVCLTGMGAYAVSRDEFGRLLLYGGQSAVHPMRLKWEKKGWTSVPTKGVVNIPMFGEVSYRPLDRQFESSSTFCGFCACTLYPFEEEDAVTDAHSPEEAWQQDHKRMALDNFAASAANEQQLQTRVL